MRKLSLCGFFCRFVLFSHKIENLKKPTELKLHIFEVWRENNYLR